MKKLLDIIFFFVISSTQVNSQVTFQWANAVGGSTAIKGSSIISDASGNIYTTGAFFGTIDFDPGPGVLTLTAVSQQAIFVTKSDALGNLIWAECLGGLTGQGDLGASIAIDNSGNVYTTGSFYGTEDFDPGPGIYTLTTNNQTGVFVSKLDASGNFVWAKSLCGMNSFDDVGTSIAVDNSGNVIITGYFYGVEDFDPGSGTYTMTTAATAGTDAFVVKLDGLGNFAWANSFKTGNSSSMIISNSLALDAAGNIYTSGYFKNVIDFDPGPGISNLTSSGNDDPFISKLDMSGNFIWARSFGNTALDRIYGMTVDASGNVYSTGEFIGTVDFDPGPGTYSLTGPSTTSNSFISKLDGSGNFIWAKQIDGTITIDIAVDMLGDVYVTGNFTGTVDFDPSAGVNNITFYGQNDAFILELNASGNFMYVGQMGGTAPETGNSLTIGASGDILINGHFYGTGDYDPGAGTSSLTYTGAMDMFTLKLNNAVGIEENKAGEILRYYPNPADEIINVQSTSKINSMKLFGVDGKLIFQKTNTDNSLSQTINISELRSGIYFVNCVIDGKENYFKVVKK